VLTVREQRSKREAMAAPRAAWESGTGYNGKCGGVRRVGAGLESVRDTTLATLDEQSGRRVGPKILFDHPAREPHPLLHQVFPVGLACALSED
jgi:hypothetical protein